MKKYILFLIFLCLSILPTQAQIASGEVVYKVTIDEKMTDSILNQNNISPELKGALEALFDRQLKTTPYLFYHLEFNSEESCFYIPNTMRNDNNLDLKKTAGNIADGLYYIDLEKKKSYHQFSYVTSDLTVTHPINKFDWSISKETKNIQGYRCFKATTTHKPDVGLGGKITAWFTPDIPFQFGPLVYAGLPGLILELKQGYYIFTANDIDLSEKEINIKKLKKGQTVTSQEVEQEKNRIKTQYVKMRSSGR